MAGRLITEFDEAGFLQPGDFIPLARGTTTLKISAAQIISKDPLGNITFGDQITNGLGTSTEDCTFNLGSLRSADGNALLNFHASPEVTYNAQIKRSPGINGNLSIVNAGTGNFNLSANSISFAANGTQTITIAADGKVGIGTQTPQSGLHIAGNQTGSSNLYLETIQTPSYTGNIGPSFISQHKGNVGYAKVNDQLLTVASQGWSSALLDTGYKDAGAIKVIATGNFNATSTRQADMTFFTSHLGTLAERLRIKSDGKIGIGTTTPAAALEIQPGHLKLGRNDTNIEGGQISFCRAADNANAWAIDQYGSGAETPGSLRVFSVLNNVDTIRMFIDSDGNVGIGNSTPQSKLDVIGNGTVLKATGGAQTFQGIAIKTGDSSSSITRTGFLTFENESNVPLTSIYSVAHTDGGSDLSFWNTPAGVRSSERRTERIKLDKTGGLYLNVNNAAIGQQIDANYKLAINGQTYSIGYRAQPGVPGQSNSLYGYAFGNGKSGVFGIKEGEIDNLGFYVNGSEKINVNQNTTTVNQQLNVTGSSSFAAEMKLTNRFRYANGSYGLIQNNDGTKFSLKVTNSGDAYGDPNNLKPFTLDLQTGKISIGDVDESSYQLNVLGSIYSTSWLRTKGETGWYSETYKGGWYMTDETWIRAYNNKNIWTDAKIGCNGGLTVGYNTTNSSDSAGASFWGKVGIGLGTQSSINLPEAKLHVKGEGNVVKITGSENAGLSLQCTGTSQSQNITQNITFENEFSIPVAAILSQTNSNGSADLYFETTPSGSRNENRRFERLRLKSDGNIHIPGNLGIGTNNPLTSLDVRGNINIGSTYGIQTNADDSYIYIAGGSANTKGAAINLTGSTNGGKIEFLTGTGPTNTIGMTLSSSGLGIGILPSINHKLTVAGSVVMTKTGSGEGNYGAILKNDGSNFYLLATNSNSPTGSENALRPFTINLANGNVTIPSVKTNVGLPVNNNSAVGYSFNNDGDTGLFSSEQGKIALYANGKKAFERTILNTTIYEDIVLDSSSSNKGPVIKTLGGIKCYASANYSTRTPNTTQVTSFLNIFPVDFVACLGIPESSNIIEVKLLNNVVETTKNTGAVTIKRGATNVFTVIVEAYKNAQGKVGYTLKGTSSPTSTAVINIRNPQSSSLGDRNDNQIPTLDQTFSAPTSWASLSATRETATSDGIINLLIRSHTAADSQSKTYESNTQVFFEAFAST